MECQKKYYDFKYSCKACGISGNSDFSCIADAPPMPSAITTASAESFLNQAASTMQQRGKDYDQPTGERSMGRTVTAFNAITGHSLTEQDGWEFMLILKQVRQWSTPKYHEDSAVDSVAYAALLAEALAAAKGVK